MVRSTPIKILIVYERAGMGHEVMADILVEHLSWDTRVNVCKQTISELIGDPLGEWLTNTWVTAWNFLIRRNLIGIADALINYLMRLTLLPIGDISSVTALHQSLDQIAPDLLICTADTAGKCLGSWAHEHQVPFFLVITDLSVFLDLVSPDAIHLCYFPETANAVQSFPLDLAYWSHRLTRSSTLSQKLQFIGHYFYDFIICYRQNRIYRNIDREHQPQNQLRCEVIGPLRAAKHLTLKDYTALRQKLDLPADIPCILIISGSLGGNFCLQHLRLLQTLFHEPLVVIIACGHDERLQTAVHQQVKRRPDMQVRSLGFVDNLHEWMAAVDIILARPSAGVMLEALLARTPLLFPRHAAANDRGAVSFVEKHQLGECFGNQHDFQEKLSQLLAERPRYQSCINTLLQNYATTVEAQRTMLHGVLFNDDFPARDQP